MRTAEHFAYGAILDYWKRWSTARRAVWRKRPRRTGSAAVTFAIAAALSANPSSQARYNRVR